MRYLGRRIIKLDPDELVLALRFREASAPLSCRALARAIGISHESIRRYQKGHCAIPAIVIVRAAAALGIPVQQILLGEQPGEAPPKPQAPAPGASGGSKQGPRPGEGPRKRS